MSQQEKKLSRYAENGNDLAKNKNIKSVAADIEKKTLRKQLGGEKIRNFGIIEKILQKPIDVVETENTFFQAEVNTMLANFPYRDFTNSCLDICDRISVLEPIESFHVQEVYPSTS